MKDNSDWLAILICNNVHSGCKGGCKGGGVIEPCANCIELAQAIRKQIEERLTSQTIRATPKGEINHVNEHVQ